MLSEARGENARLLWACEPQRKKKGHVNFDLEFDIPRHILLMEMTLILLNNEMVEEHYLYNLVACNYIEEFLNKT